MSNKCAKCGAEGLPDDVKFCPDCGAVLDSAPAPQPQYQQPPQPQPQYQPQSASQPQYQQPPQYQPQYAVPPVETPPAKDSKYAVMSVGQYILTSIVCAIPFIGFIMTLVWAFSSSGNRNRANFCRANLIMILIGIVLSILLTVLLGAAISQLIADIDFDSMMSQFDMSGQNFSGF